ncbi:MAG: phosphoenolpyruvate carboxykinase domain-containing protein [Acidimicrobiales bacterium]
MNWFRKGADGSFLWPGYGDNSRVLKWIIERLGGQEGGPGDGHRPGPHRRRWTPPGSTSALASAPADLTVDNEAWRRSPALRAALRLHRRAPARRTARRVARSSRSASPADERSRDLSPLCGRHRACSRRGAGRWRVRPPVPPTMTGR